MSEITRAICYAAAALAIGAVVATFAFAEPLVFEWTDTATCARLGMTAPCSKRCGNLSYKKERKIWVWRDCPQMVALLRGQPVPSPRPTTTGRPTVAPTEEESRCITDPAHYCWGIGATLSSSGECFANCDCIPRSSGRCAR